MRCDRRIKSDQSSSGLSNWENIILVHLGKKRWREIFQRGNIINQSFKVKHIKVEIL